jgi:hypothetical protein
VLEHWNWRRHQVRRCGSTLYSRTLIMLYGCDTTIIFTLKMESVTKNIIFALKMMVKSCLEKIFLKFLPAGNYIPLLHKSAPNHRFSNNNTYLSAYFPRPLFTIIFRPKIAFLVTDSILRVKMMVASQPHSVLILHCKWLKVG